MMAAVSCHLFEALCRKESSAMSCTVELVPQASYLVHTLKIHSVFSECLLRTDTVIGTSSRAENETNSSLYGTCVPPERQSSSHLTYQKHLMQLTVPSFFLF